MPCSPVVKTWAFTATDPGSVSGQGTHLQAGPCHKKKQQKKAIKHILKEKQSHIQGTKSHIYYFLSHTLTAYENQDMTITKLLFILNV